MAYMQQQGGPYVLNPTVVAGGGGTSTNGTTRLDGTIGQSALGLSSGGTFSLNAGFWQAASPCNTSISNQPTPSSVCVGSQATFSVTASGSGLTFQWRKNGSNLSNGGNISGATTATLTINPVSTGDAATYDVIIGSGCGNTASNTAALTVFDYQLSASSQNFGAAGGTGSTNVITNAICGWTAASNDSFIHITSGSSGTGNGTVMYSVDANVGAARIGTMTIAGLTFTVNQSAPTAVDLITFVASRYDNGTFIEWQTGKETNNLGFNLYREESGKRALVTNQLVAGSALTAGSSLSSGSNYAWWDNSGSANATYWLEDIDLNGQSAWHGPLYAKPISGVPPVRSQAATFSRLNSVSQSDTSRVVEKTAATLPAITQPGIQGTPSTQAAVKISVNHEGWYRLTQAELINAGLAKDADARFLQLYVDGREVPMVVNTGKDGRFDDTSSIEFYGLGIDTPSTDARTYWLTVGSQQGKRIQIQRGEGVSSISTSFPQTVERRDRSLYFAALLNGDKENFFGAVVASSPVDLNLTLRHVATTQEAATLDLSLQGVTLQTHRVLVQINGTSLGEVVSGGQQNQSATFAVPANLLREGANTVRLLAENGGADVSLVDALRLSYAHSFNADDDALKFTAQGHEAVTINGFTNRAISVFDVTDADNAQELSGKLIEQKDGSFGITVAATENGTRTLLAVTDGQMKHPQSLQAELPSSWRSPSKAADFVIIAPRSFFAALESLRAARQAAGLQTVLVDITDVYDEFSFGNKSPQAVKDFLNYARSNWQTKPRFVLLAGDASYDPKNYLGFGNDDLVPTKLLDTDYLETASDEWFTDFNNDGIGELAMGRLPIRTTDEATAVVAKLLRSDSAKTPDSGLLVADRNEGFDFESASAILRTQLEARLKIDDLRRGQVTPDEARRQLFAALTKGEKVVNYIGHGSVNLWNGQLLNADEARALSNDTLPLFTLMNCLNGYFADAGQESLGEALLKAERGGAMAVWASSGLTTPNEQAVMNQEFYRQLLSKDTRGLTPTLGEAVQRAKAVIGNLDIRRTWVLLGDPTMRLK
jgi:hypothetical protein